MKKLGKRQKRWIEKTVKSNRRYKKFVYTRLFVYLLLFALQFCAYVLGFVWLGRNWWIFNFVASLIGLGTVLHLVSRTDKPSSKLNWVLLLLLLPVVGVPTYFAFADGRPLKKLVQKLGKEREKNLVALQKQVEFAPQTSGDGAYLLEKQGFCAYADGAIEYYPSGAAAYKQMLADLEKAEKYILVEYFILAGGKMWEGMLSVLLKKAMQGVKVFIIYDDFGSLLVLPPRYDRYLESLHDNIRCVCFNPVKPFFSARMNNRDHRKMLVVDGKIAFTGGINLADEYIGEKVRFGQWKDSAIRVSGSAVGAFVVAFFNLYNSLREPEMVEEYLSFVQPAEGEEGLIQPYDDMPCDGVQVAEAVYLDMIETAKDYLYITTPYLILDDFMRAALCRAAMRGVDVRIATPGVPDKKLAYRLTRANYDILMRAGVKIYEYTPGFLHAKNVLSDGKAVVGTVNFDYRSLYLHFENAVFFTKPSAVNSVKADCEEIFLSSKLCTATGRGFWGRLLNAVLRVFETLF